MWQVKIFADNRRAEQENEINAWFKEHPKVHTIDPYQTVDQHGTLILTIFYRE